MLRFRRSPEIVLGLPTGGLLEVVEARGPVARLLGLALLVEPPRAALLIPRCRSVHTWGMRFPVDVAFVAPVAGGAGLRVLATHRSVQPRRAVSCRTAGARRSGVAVLELPAGGLARLCLEPGALTPVLARRAPG